MKLLDIFEGEVVKFKRPVPDSLKYAAAKDKQSPEEHQTVSDLARSIVLKNIDKIFAGEQLPDEDAKMLKNIVDSHDIISRMNLNILINQLVNKTIDIHNKNHPNDKISRTLPDQRAAYIDDDPERLKYTVRTKNQTYKFDNREEMELFILTKFAGEYDEWSKKEKEDILDVIEKLPGLEKRKLEPYDPAQPDSPFLRADLEKFLKPYKWEKGKKWFINVFEFGDDKYIELVGKDGSEQKWSFDNVDEMNHWMDQNKTMIMKWIKEQSSED
ncbi:MAG: hypothetical protein WC284_12550 [Candidimonas sp.]